MDECGTVPTADAIFLQVPFETGACEKTGGQIVKGDQVEAMVLADRIAVMAQGEILQVGNPYELYCNPRSALVAEFFGSMNWLRGKVLDKDLIETEIGTVEASFTDATARVVVGIRPEDVKINSVPAVACRQIDGVVSAATFVGDQMIYELRINNSILTAKTMVNGARAEGRVSVYLPR